MKYLALILLLSVSYPQDVNQVSDVKRSTVYGQDCDDTEYRHSNGSPNWKNYGRWLSECDSIQSVRLDEEFAERSRQRQREKAIQDSIEALEYDNIDLDMDAMWENTVWEEIEDVVTIEAEVEQITSVAGVRGAEAEDEALEHLYYRRSMKRLSKLDLEKAYGKLILKRDQLISKKQATEKVDQYLSMLAEKIEKYDNI
jgi:hypothetical protein